MTLEEEKAGRGIVAEDFSAAIAVLRFANECAEVSEKQVVEIVELINKMISMMDKLNARLEKLERNA